MTRLQESLGSLPRRQQEEREYGLQALWFDNNPEMGDDRYYCSDCGSAGDLLDPDSSDGSTEETGSN